MPVGRGGGMRVEGRAMRQTRTQTTTQKMTRILAAVAVLVLSLATPRVDAEPCGLGWTAGFYSPGIDGTVRAQAVFDDGCGPALYVGGEFTDAAGITVNGIARWDGVHWSTVAGPLGLGLSEDVFAFPVTVHALAVFDDGTGPALYAAGAFSTAGGVTVNNIARWNGSRWSALTAPGGTGVGDYGFSSSVYALTVFDDGTGPALYAGGSFRTAGGVTVNRIAKWDGVAWSPLTGPSSTGVTKTVRALTVFDDGTGPVLVAGGEFSAAGGVAANFIAKWDGSDWSPLIGPSDAGLSAGGTGAGVYSLAVFDDGTGPALFAGGRFIYAGGATANRIAKWDGSVWSPLTGPSGTGVNDTVYTLTVFDDGTGQALYAGGLFATAGGVFVYKIAKWDGSTWSPLTGRFSPGVGGWVYALTVFDDGTGPALVAGGEFDSAGGQTAHSIAKWDGGAWSLVLRPSIEGVDDWVRALTVFDDGTGPALYAGGDFDFDRFGHHIARWDGSAWSPLSGPSGSGVSAPVYALTVLDDGTGPALYAGGAFPHAGGVPANFIAKWDGSSWSPLAGPSGTGVSGWVYALTVFDDGTGPALYAGGDFTTAGGVTVNGIAKWDGSAWSPLTGPAGTGGGWVYALTVFDDGTGPALISGGDFYLVGGMRVGGTAKWDGVAWSPLTGPDEWSLSGVVRTLKVFDDGMGPALYAGGYISTNFAPYSHIARLRPCSPDRSCPPNPSCNPADLAEPFDTLDLADIVAFVTAFGNMAPDADLAEPVGLFDLADLLAFITAFGAGCP